MLTTAQNELIQTSESGFSVIQQSDRNEFHDHDVVGLCVDSRRQCDAMGKMVLEETLRIHVIDDKGERWVMMTAEVGPWDRDPLRTIRQRLVNVLVERSCETLLSAGDVEGGRWSLSLIHFYDASTGRTCPPQEIAAIRWSSDQLCLFHEDDSAPFACFDRSEENTIVLGSLLEHVVEDVKSTNDHSSSRGLGNLTHEVIGIEMQRLTARRIAVLSSVPVALMIYFLPLWTTAIGIVLVLLISLAVRPLLNKVPATLRLYERAAAWTLGSQENVLLLDDIGSMTASHFDQRREDGSTCPTLQLSYQSRSRAHESIQFQSLLTSDNRDDMEAILISSAKLIASRMRSLLDNDGQVVWTKGLIVTRERIIYLDPATDRQQQIKRSEIQGWSLSNTKMILALTSGEAISIPTSYPNFYPGFVLLHDLKWFDSARD